MIHYADDTSSLSNSASSYVSSYTSAYVSPYEGYRELDNSTTFDVKNNILHIVKTSTIGDIQMYPSDWLKFKQQPWIIDIFLHADAINDVKTLLPHYTNLHNALLAKKYDICNSMLKELDVSSPTEVLLTGLLRLTSTWKHDLPYWQQLLDKVEDELKHRKLDSEKLLIGLV